MKRIKSIAHGMAITFLLIIISGEAKSQKTTEVYIPIGESPGVSGKMTIIGKVEQIRNKDHSITVSLSDNSKLMCKMDKDTPVYLDKSTLKQSNTSGDWGYIKPGMLIEAKYKDRTKTGPIEWIKVQMK